MSRKKKAETVPENERPKKLAEEEAVWKKRILKSKAFQAKYSTSWEDNRRLVFDEPAGSDTRHGTANAVPYGWGLYEGLETAIYVQNPDILVTARDPAQRPVAQRLRDIIAYDFEQMDVKGTGNLCLLDTFICGYGAVIEDVQTHHEYDAEGKRTGTVSAQDFELRRLEPRDVLFDPAARRLDLSDSRYLWVAWYPTIEELRRDEAITDLPENIEEFPEASEYTRGKADGASEATVSRQGVAGQIQGSGEKDPAFKTICVWECYDKVNREVLYITDHEGFIIGRASWPCNLRFGPKDLFPVTLLYSHPVPGRFYPKPEAELIANQLRKINITETLIDEDSRTKFRKIVTLSGILSDDQKSKVTDESVKNALISVDVAKLTEVLGISSPQIDLASIDMSKLVTMMEDVAPKKDLFVRYDMLEKQIQHTVGYGPASRGGLPSTRSAREAMMINAKQDQRLDKRKDRINDFNRDVARKHVRYLQRYMATDRYAKVLSKGAQLGEYFAYNRQGIDGEFEFEVVAGSTTPRNTEVRKAAVLQMAQAIMPALQQAQQSIRPIIEEIADVNGMSDMVDRCFGNVKEKAKGALRTSVAFNAGQAPPEALLEALMTLLMAELTPAEMQMEAEAMKKGQLPGSSPEGGEATGQRGDPNPQATTQGVA